MAESRERTEKGTYAPTVPDEDILDAVAENEPAGTAEVGDVVGLARQNADYRLRNLEEQGAVQKKKIGRTLAWSTAEVDE
jgi:predicted transcriptional regulator